VVGDAPPAGVKFADTAAVRTGESQVPLELGLFDGTVVQGDRGHPSNSMSMSVQ
jgi:hypothetical protein